MCDNWCSFSYEDEEGCMIMCSFSYEDEDGYVITGAALAMRMGRDV